MNWLPFLCLLMVGMALVDTAEEERQRKDVKECPRSRKCKRKDGICQATSVDCDGVFEPKICRGTDCGCCYPEESKDSSTRSKNSELVEPTTSGTQVQSSNGSEWSGGESDDQHPEDTSYLTQNLNKNMNKNMDNIETFPSRCLIAGGLLSPSQDQCFIFMSENKIWTDALGSCGSAGYQMANVKPHNAIWLRDAIVLNKAPTDWVWVGGQGTGTELVYVASGVAVCNGSPLWYPGQPGTYLTTSWCLLLLTSDAWIDQYPYQPYYSQLCTYPRQFVCELLNV